MIINTYSSLTITSAMCRLPIELMDRIIEFTWKPLPGVSNDDTVNKKWYQDVNYQETWLRAYITHKDHGAEGAALGGWDNDYRGGILVLSSLPTRRIPKSSREHNHRVALAK